MEQNDYELVYLAREKNEVACNILHEKYRPLIEKKAKEFYYYANNKGLEINDFVQEAMIGFEEAINNYDENSNTLFYTFVNVCVECQLKTVLTKLNRNKHKILNDAISLDYLYDDEASMLNFIKEDNANPEYGLIDIESEKELYNKIVGFLTNKEKTVLDLKLKGFDYQEIANILKKEPKVIANTLYRIKIKVKKILNNE